MLCNPTPAAREVASINGTLEAACPAIWQVLLYYRHLQIQLIKSLQASHHNEVVDRESRESYDSGKW